MQEFLKTVAFHYAQKMQQESVGTGMPPSLALSRYLFCFPNRRCGLFFAKYLREAFGSPCFVPSITTISELFGLFSQRMVPDRTTLLFRLYTLYRQLSARPDKEEFDQFVFWGDMLLSDFDDVDKYLVDADALFRNVKDLKDIEAEFEGFDPEIVQVIQSFWRNYRPAGCPEDAKREVFGQTWSILLDLYRGFREHLAADNLAYEGMLEREVVENLRSDAEALLKTSVMEKTDKVVFVGLSAISKADRQLMFWLQMHERAEFCWDYADPRLSPSATRTSSASFFSAQNLSDFPNEIPEEQLAEGLVPESERQYSLYAIPSGVGQTQMTSILLRQWKRDICQNPLHTAVVLPDEKLLLPMLYAVPADLGTFNVTMGYGLKDTPIASFVSLLASLHDSIKQRQGGQYSYYYKPVLALLEHNFVQALAPEQAKQLIDAITRRNLSQVPLSELTIAPLLQLMFRPVTDARDAVRYLLDLLDYLLHEAQQEIEQQAQQQEEHSLFASQEEFVPKFTVVDHEFLFHFNRTVERLAQELEAQSFSFTAHTLFILLEKLVAGVSVPFSGEPLQGIQVMGVLETRGMDFDNVIILSMNEGVFPAKPVSNTFIPMSLRSAFDMPTQRHRDAVFAYHFYRLISRAHRVAMIYDSRTEGSQMGEESRYVKQLRYLMEHDDLQPLTVRSNISIPSSLPFQVNKSPEVMEALGQYLEPNGRHSLSATAINDYILCPLRFYLKYVESLREEDEVTEGIDVANFGNILHYALCRLYAHAEGKRVDAGLLDGYIAEPEGEVTRLIHEGFREIMGIEELEGYNLLVARILVQYAVQTLSQDKKRCPFLYIKGETPIHVPYPLDGQRRVRMKCIIDRMEQSLLAGRQVRIIDYKTGSSFYGSKLCFNSLHDLFTTGKRHEAMQVMYYCLMLQYARPEQLAQLPVQVDFSKLEPHLFFVRDFHSSEQADTSLKVGGLRQGTPIVSFDDYRDEFEEEFRQVLSHIFDPSIPFTQCSDEHTCSFCPFSGICKRGGGA